MTPKEKALDLVEDMFNCPETGYNEHKIECALVAVDEILDTIKWCIGDSQVEYWQDVKKELEKL
jgi:hypothetical protein